MAAAMKVAWKPDTGLPSVGGGASSSGKSKSGGGDSLSKLSATPNIWQREKGQGQVDGLFVPPLDPCKQKKLEKKNVKQTAGAKWFDMPASTMTSEMKRELQLLNLHSVLDPKRHYKANDSKSIPKFFQVGTVIEGPADFNSGRLTKKERKLTFADELLTNASLKSYRKRKYTQIQDQYEDGGKKFWKKKKNRQRPSWAKH